MKTVLLVLCLFLCSGCLEWRWYHYSNLDFTYETPVYHNGYYYYYFHTKHTIHNRDCQPCDQGPCPQDKRYRWDNN